MGKSQSENRFLSGKAKVNGGDTKGDHVGEVTAEESLVGRISSSTRVLPSQKINILLLGFFLSKMKHSMMPIEWYFSVEMTYE